MFGIGLPEMIVILAVALIVVGPDKLPDMAKTIAKWVLELKKTVNQVKESLADEDDLMGSVGSDIRKTGNELKSKLKEVDHFSWKEPGEVLEGDAEKPGYVLDMEKEVRALKRDQAGETDSFDRPADTEKPESGNEAGETPPDSSP